MIWGLTIFSAELKAQTNLVNNNSFETFSTCPNTLSQITFATGWQMPTLHIGSSDYFNACQTNTTAGVPTNTFGSTAAAGGQAYSGGYIFVNGYTNYREYVVGQLSQAMVAGQSYVVSFQYARSTNCRYASSALGFYLSSSVPSNGTSGVGNLPVTPTSVNPSTNVLSSTSWQTYSDTIVANGGEQYITIGSFVANSTGTLVNSSAGISGAYMLFDEVEIFVYNGIFGDSNICLGDTGLIYALLDTNFYWVDSANPTTVLSTDDTLFVAPTSATTYWAISPLDTFSFTVNVHSLPTVFAGADIEVCEGDWAVKIVNLSPYDLLWSDSSTDSVFTTQSDGTHWLQISYYTCTETDSFQVNYFEFPEFSLPNDTMICDYDNLVVGSGLTPPLLFNWSTGATTPNITVDAPGAYMLTVTNANCAYSDTINVTYHAPISVELGNDKEFCYSSGELVSATVTGANLYQWNTGSTAASTLATTTGNYVLTVSNGFCTAVDSVHYSFFHYPTVDLGPDVLFCEGEPYTINTGLIAPLQFVWMNNTTEPSLTTLFEGLFWVEVSDENCAMRDSIVLQHYPELDVTLGQDLFVCEGTVVEVNPQYTGTIAGVTWNDLSTEATRQFTQSGTYYITVTDGYCTASDQLSIFMFDKPEVDLGQDTLVCPDYVFYFDVTQPTSANYLWSFASTHPADSFQAKDSTWVSVTVSTEYCSTTDSLFMRLRPTPPVSFTSAPSDFEICTNNKLTLVATSDSSATSVVWNSGIVGPKNTVSEPGTYHVTISDGICETNKSVIVKPAKEPKTTDYLSQLVERTLCLGEEIRVEVDDSAYTQVRWNDSSTGDEFIISERGTYSYEAYHQCGVERDTVVIEACECPIWIPTSFTPDGDGQNDYFSVNTECQIQEFNLKVFNRWGTQLFETGDLKSGWDGMTGGEPASLGVYGYAIELIYTEHGETIETVKTGTVTLVK